MERVQIIQTSVDEISTDLDFTEEKKKNVLKFLRATKCVLKLNNITETIGFF